MLFASHQVLVGCVHVRPVLNELLHHLPAAAPHPEEQRGGALLVAVGQHLKMLEETLDLNII